MSKQITKERIKRLHELLADARKRATEEDAKVVMRAAELGFKCVAGIDTQADRDRFELELDYLEQPKSPEELQAILQRWPKEMKRWGDRREWIDRIQVKHQVSGLVDSVVHLGSDAVKTFEQDEDLVLIDSDLELLRPFKRILFEKWVDYALLNNLDFYWFKDEQWEQVSYKQLFYASRLPFYDWARVHENVSYFSPSHMREYGYDYARSIPARPDDKRRHEVHLIFGAGLDMDSSEQALEACACNLVPLY